MTPRSTSRVQRCGEAQARTRLAHAHKFLEVAELIADADDADYASASAALAVLAGIAASDAACCQALGRRARGQDHREAMSLVERVQPEGRQAANALRRLLDMKDEAHYGFFDISGQHFRTALRQAQSLISFAETVTQRGAGATMQPGD
jgi:hypothetical protein